MLNDQMFTMAQILQYNVPTPSNYKGEMTKMLNKTTLNKITNFEEITLEKLMDILEQISAELLKSEDYLSAKVQSLHRLYLSFLNKFQQLKKNLLNNMMDELLGFETADLPVPFPENNQNPSNTTKSKRNKNKKAKKNSNKLDLSFIEPEEQLSGLLCPPQLEVESNNKRSPNPLIPKGCLSMV